MELRKIIAASICGCLLTSAQLMAADPQARESVGHHRQWKNPDHALATCVAIGNQEEIAIAKFAESKAKTQDVKEFAKMLVSDHQEFLRKLEKFAPEATRDGYLSERVANGNDRDNSNPTSKPGVNVEVKGAQVEVNGAQGNITPAHLDFVALHRELAENCIRESKEAMGKKEGIKFDECFIGTQIVKHAEMKNKLTVFERHTSGELRDLFASGRQTTEKHMKRAEDIMKKLNDQNSQRQVSDARN